MRRLAMLLLSATPLAAQTDRVPSFAALLEQPVALERGYGAEHPRLFFHRRALDGFREKARQHPAAWQSFLQQS